MRVDTLALPAGWILGAVSPHPVNSFIHVSEAEKQGAGGRKIAGVNHCDVTRLKYVESNFGPKESAAAESEGTDHANFDRNRRVAPASQRRGAHVDFIGAQRGRTRRGDSILNARGFSLDGAADLSGLARSVAEPARDR